jgi:hypothetical protein
MKISSVDVRQFKQRYSDENELIAGIIHERLYDKFEELIVDVGAGMGDITSRALAAKRVVQLDILDYRESALIDLHCRVVTDFFDYTPTNGQKIGTLFFSHVLQFLDQSVDRLNDKIQTLCPGRIITVTNLNDGFMGEVIQWTNSNVQNANPEIHLADFPRGYDLEDEIHFKGHVRCPSFSVLGKQVSYLVDSQPSTRETIALQHFLQANLASPEFAINQTVKVHKKT